MLTTCTECGTRFRLTSQQLRQAEGQVRCSRCGEVFDAFVHLRGDDGTPWSLPPELPADHSGTEAPDLGEPDQEAQADATETSLGDTDELDVEIYGGRVEPHIDDLFADLDTEPGSSAEIPDDIETPSGEGDLLADEIDGLQPEDTDGEPGSADARELPPSDRVLPPADHHLLHQKQHGRHRGWWSLGVLLLGLLLGAQWVNANRISLSRDPVIGSALSAVYSILGNPLPSQQDLDAWQISETNVTSDPNQAGGLSITGSLANTASFSQSWPLLRVELTNRYGDIMRVRDFLPDQYLPASEVTSLPAAGSATHFRIDVVDPGADAVGFKIAPCMDLPAGRVCASKRESD